MVREFRSILAFISSIALAVFSYANDLVHFASDAVSFDWRADAHTSLALDSVMHDVDVKPATALQRAKAFLQRALNHPWWITDHFDPGRHVASTA